MLWVALVCHWPTNFCLIAQWFHGMIYSVPYYYDTNFSWLYRNIRKKEVTKFHIQLVLSMLLMLLSNLINYIFNTEFNILLGQCICVLVSFLWYTILVVLMWMGAEWLLLFQKLLFVFKKTTTLYIIVVSLICWGESITGGHHNAGSIMLNHYYQSFCPDNLNHKPCRQHHSWLWNDVAGMVWSAYHSVHGTSCLCTFPTSAFIEPSLPQLNFFQKSFMDDKRWMIKGTNFYNAYLSIVFFLSLIIM